MRIATVVSLLHMLLLCQTYSQTQGYMQINSSLSVHLIVTNPIGQRTGADPRGVHSDTAYKPTWLREIPEANYSFSSFAGEEDSSDADWIESHEFVYSFHLPENAGEYTIQAIGTDSAPYSIHVSLDKNLSDSTTMYSLVAHGTIVKDSVVTYLLVVSSSDRSEVKLVKLLDPESPLKKLRERR